MTIPRGPQALPPEPPEDNEESSERGLRRIPDLRDPAAGASFHTMAEALRANADALHQIDTSQKRMAESLRRHDRVSDVVTSTKALNETFRGLNEIQRGLLEALVRERGRSSSGGPWALLSLVLLIALLAILAWSQVTEDDRVPRDFYEDARRRANEMGGTAAALKESRRDLQGRLSRTEEDAETLRRQANLDASEMMRLNEELKRNKAQVAQYLKVKEQADAAGVVIVNQERLRRENDDLRHRLSRMEHENKNLLDKFLNGIAEGKLGDPEAIKQVARDLKVLPEIVEPGPFRARTTRELARIRRRLKRLLEGAVGKDGYQLLKLKDADKDSALVDVEVGRYENHMGVSTIYAASLVIRLDQKRDGVELHFRDGYIVNHTRPNEKIPLDPADGHSVFLKGVDVKGWLEYVGDAVNLAKSGEIRWK